MKKKIPNPKFQIPNTLQIPNSRHWKLKIENWKFLAEPGFTLIELLVVIAVLAFLSALLLPNFVSTRQRGRDVQRKSDLKQIQSALELYKLDQSPLIYPSSMPVSLCGKCWTSGGSGATCPSGNVYIRKFPCDPKALTTPTPYVYARDSGDSLKYTLSSCLENPADSDRDQTSVCGTDASYTVAEP
ncbi:type II secretion system protein [Candidatus Gottesmanbacteria bacterium]|nr:type II secretion system protein [Candidatus Gottesmanbacteria bacterium]